MKGLSDTVIEGASEGPTVALVYFSSQEKEEGRAHATFCDCTETKNKMLYIFQVLRDHGVYMYVVYIWKWSSAHALGGVSGVASFITTDEQLQ